MLTSSHTRLLLHLRDKFDLSWTTGGHVSAALDYFMTRGVAFLRLFLPDHPFDQL